LVPYEFRKATQEDVQHILATVRQENLDELELIGIGIQDALEWSLGHSEEAFVAVFDGVPVCAFGVIATDDPHVGRPWMVGTSEIDKHKLAFLRGSKVVVAELLTYWGTLRNVADARNARGLRWLRFMGFTIHPAEHLGGGFFIHRFEKSADYHSVVKVEPQTVVSEDEQVVVQNIVHLISVANEDRSTIRKAMDALGESMKKLPRYGGDYDHAVVNKMYRRSIFMKKGSVIATKIHTEANFSFVMQGRARCISEEGDTIIQGPAAFITEPGTRRLLIIEEDMVFITMHPNPTETTDFEALEDRLSVITFAELEARNNYMEVLS